MKTPLEVFDDYYAPDDSWAQKCRADMAAALEPKQEQSEPQDAADLAKAKAARLIAAAPRMLEFITSIVHGNAAERIDEASPSLARLARALLREIHGGES